MYKTLEEAAVAVDEMFNLAFQNSGSLLSSTINILMQILNILHFFQWPPPRIVVKTAETKAIDQQSKKMRKKTMVPPSLLCVLLSIQPSTG